MNCEPVICNGNDLPNVLADIRARGGVPDHLETGVGGKKGNYRVSYFERGNTPDEGSSSKDKQQASGNDSDKVATVLGLLLQDERRARNAMTRKSSGVCAELSALTKLEVAPEREARTVEGTPQSPETGSNPVATTIRPDVGLKSPSRRVATDDERSDKHRTTANCGAKPYTTRPDQGPLMVKMQPVVGGAANFVMRRDRSDATQTSTRHVSEAASKQRDPVVGTEMRADGRTRVSTDGDTTEPAGNGLAHPAHNDSIEQRMENLKATMLASGKLRRIKPEHVRSQHNDP